MIQAKQPIALSTQYTPAVSFYYATAYDAMMEGLQPNRWAAMRQYRDLS